MRDFLPPAAEPLAAAALPFAGPGFAPRPARRWSFEVPVLGVLRLDALPLRSAIGPSVATHLGYVYRRNTCDVRASRTSWIDPGVIRASGIWPMVML